MEYNYLNGGILAITLLSLFFTFRYLVANRSLYICYKAVGLFILSYPYPLQKKVDYYGYLLYSLEETVFLRPLSFGIYCSIKPEFFELLKPYVDEVYNEE